MSKRENVVLPAEDLIKQKEIISWIKQTNDMEHQMNGKQKLAMVVTYGCQQNENDSERLKGMLKEMGYEFTEDKEEADLILYNTCCVRENAELKVFGKIGALKHLKANKPNMIVGICGCMMQQEHIVDKIKKKYKHVDIVFGTHTLYKFPEILRRAMNESYTVIDILNSEGHIIEDMPILRENGVKAWISIMYGCNNFCSYCIVPYVRGRERSRAPEDILSEIKNLVAQGYKEITLLGQNVNSYGNDLREKEYQYSSGNNNDENSNYENKHNEKKYSGIDRIDFSDLLKMVNEIEGIERIRFMTSHPKDISDKLIKTMKECSKVCEQLHLPFQAGSDKVLKAMNRNYTKDMYLDKIKKIKKEMPEIALSSDIIVGFPGETNEDFNETLKIVDEVQFDILFTFIYSPRKGTPAEKISDVLTENEKKHNFQRLVNLQNEISLKKNNEYIGKTVEVLVEGISKNNSDTLTGRTRTGKIVNFMGDVSYIGELVNIYIENAHTWSLFGRLQEDLV